MDVSEEEVARRLEKLGSLANVIRESRRALRLGLGLGEPLRDRLLVSAAQNQNQPSSEAPTGTEPPAVAAPLVELLQQRPLATLLLQRIQGLKALAQRTQDPEAEAVDELVRELRKRRIAKELRDYLLEEEGEEASSKKKGGVALGNW